MAFLQPVPAPIAGPPRYGLLVAANVVNDALRWEQGYTFSPEACTGGGVYDPCSEAPGIDPEGRPAAVGNVPFGIWDADRCSTMGGDSADDRRARARRALEANQSQHVASEFWTGALATAAAWGDNQRLAAGAGVPVASDGLNVTRSFAELTQALADQQGNRRGMIHCTPQTLDLAAAAMVVRREGNLWLTATDHIVVADAGYPGTGPEGQVRADTDTWAFATGLVVVRLGEVVVLPDSDAEAVDLRSPRLSSSINSALYVASRLASPAWDGCALAAANIDLTLAI